MKKQFLEAGKVLRTHGIRGEVRFMHWCDSPEVLKKVPVLYFDSQGTKPLKIVSRRLHGDMILFGFEGYDSPESARALVNRVLFADRDQLVVPEGATFISDLIGLDLIDDADGSIIGKITDVVNRGSCDLYLVDLGGGREEYFPAVKEFIVSKDLDAGIRVRVPEGLFDGGAQ